MEKIDPKNLWALNRSVLALIRTSISMIVLGFVVEKFDFFLKEMSLHLLKNTPETIYESKTLYHYLGLFTTFAGIILCIYTIFYYKKQLRLLKESKAKDDEHLFYAISLFITTFGIVILLGMLFLS
ncbi:YidH family protein [Desulfurobacterium thermolithotrophum]|uniref:YidH family protein n=1 Tax=Desulfurobacterium thermolithotrophum TaxID=64160 RepID=UPI0013D8C16C|nr:DUF202 domain-containing protein [Desulfurobacterium thermolithotrophum]